jgi:predicted exporter
MPVFIHPDGSARKLLFRVPGEGGKPMKWTGLYLVGYVVLLVGGLLALWKIGVLASIGPTWTAIGVVIAIGLGIMMSVANSGKKETIEVDKG